MAIPSPGGVAQGGGLKPKAFAQYNAAATTAAFDLATAPSSGVVAPSGNSIALVQAEAQALRVRPKAAISGGGAPTTAVGFLIPAGEAMLFHGDLSNWQFINAAAGTIVNVVYLG